MDKAILKKFAIESRQDLMEKIKNKINTFYVDEEFKNEQKGELYILSNEKHSLSLTHEEYKKRELLIKRIKELSLEQVIEEAAYTWFNRIIAIRYMEINNMLPLTRDNQSLGIRVLSSKDNTLDPEILKFTNLMNPELDINFKKEKYVELKDDNEKFKYVLLLVCKKLGRVIPQVFDGVTDYIDILIPDNLLNDTGFVTKIIKEVPESNYNQVEIIGWMYQYYNQTEKDRVISAKKAYKKNEIPYATQLFTPDWIVKYMVENSLGRYWIEHNGSVDLIKNWKYFIKDNINLEEKPLTVKEVSNMMVKEFNNTLVKKLVKIDPKDIKCIDPCCGSGHILVYMFEVLFQIYESYGYSKKNIAEMILENNLYGLDIDDRAGQLSILSVLLKAREYDKEIFNKEIVRNLNVMSIQESNNISQASIDNINSEILKEEAQYLIDRFKDAKEIGSLLNLNYKDYLELEKNIYEDTTILGIELRKRVIPLIKIARILSKQYNIVITNPPYMANKWMSKQLKNYLHKIYFYEKHDLFSAFIKRCIIFSQKDGYIGMITMQSLLFLSSYAETRNDILNLCTIKSLLQIGYNSFPELNSQVAHATTFILKKDLDNSKGIYINLNTGKTNDDKEKVFLSKIEKKEFYYNKNDDFLNMPDTIFAYWITNKEKNILKDSTLRLENYMEIKQGLATGNNEKYVRLWTEVNFKDIGFGFKSVNYFLNSGKLYAPYNKGGDFRKWYGNREYVIKFNKHNFKLLSNEGNHLPSREYYFKDGITWSLIGNDNFAARLSSDGFVFDVGGSSGFPKDNKETFMILAFLCSKITINFLKMLNPTINFQVGDIKNLPYIKENNKEIKELSKKCVELAKEDWDSFETSWDFSRHPLLPKINSKDIINKVKLERMFIYWQNICNNRFKVLKDNEEKINELFINMYDLKGALTKIVEDKSITVHKADIIREIKSLISYAVGCMFGRYSLDKEGLVYAGGDFDKVYKKHKSEYGGWAGASQANYKVLNDNGKEIELSFEVDNDNVIPITDEAYLGDDIVERFKKFISVVYGKETLNENLDFIADTLGKKGTETSEDTIRRYFVNDFFNDHVKIYQKRPIYWLFDSGKKNGFKALIYMHRYNENLVPKIRLDYLHRMQTTYEKLLSDINYKLTTELSMIDKKETQKRQADLNAKLQEIKEYDEKIAHIANQRIKIDLDDGVKVNYAKFQDILAKIK